MDRATIHQKLLALLEEIRGEKYERFDESMEIRTELGMDSVDLVSLILDVQTVFRVEIGIVDLEQVVTVGQLIDLFQAKLAAKGPAGGDDGTRRAA